jgi:RNA polymerase sigma-70 factor, ECF subfamily
MPARDVVGAGPVTNAPTVRLGDRDVPETRRRAKLTARFERMADQGGIIAFDLQSLPDSRLVAQALAGSQPACQEIVRRYQRPVYNLICRMVRDAALAEDVAQEAFLKAFRGLGGFDSTRPFRSWIFRIAHNAALDAIRQRGREPILEPEAHAPAIPPPPDPVEAGALGDALSSALDALRPEWRAAIVLRYQEGCSYEEIAAAMGIPEGTAKTFVHRGRKQMAAALTAAGWAPWQG